MFFGKGEECRLHKKRPDTYLGSGVEFKGEIIAVGLLSVDGKLEGKIRGESLFIGERSVVLAEVNVKKLHVRGSIRGGVVCEEFAFLDAGSDFVGELTTLNLEVKVGAVVDAKMKSHKVSPQKE